MSGDLNTKNAAKLQAATTTTICQYTKARSGPTS